MFIRKPLLGQLDDLRQGGHLPSEGIEAQVSQQRAQDSERFVKNADFKVVEGQGLQRGGNEDKMRDRLVKEAWASLHKVGYKFVTVVNCLPWELRLQPPLDFRIPGRKKDELFKLFTLREARMDIRDLGDGKVSVSPMLPVEFAMEFARQYEPEGGVFYFEGAEPPADFTQLLEKAYAKYEDWCWKQYENAKNDWQRHNHDSRFITERQKDATKFLYEHGKIDQLPEFVTATKGEAGTKECPNCAELIKKKAKQCRFCGAVLEEAAGFTRAATPPMRTQEEDVERKAVESGQLPDPLADDTLTPGEAADLAAAKTDAAIMDTPDSDLPAPKPARANKKKKEE